ncbi:MAG: hypothetical protein JNG84_02335 [Archangium sp.]|nr:hypothetical protein [Archangium sp.]
MLSVYTDGSAHERACLPGGWAFAVVRADELLAERCGGERSTTNNVMELHAALAGLREVQARGWHVGETVELVSDSRVTLDVAAGVWRARRDVELSEAVRAAFLALGAQARWVRGHSDDRWNDYVDGLAHEAKQALVPERVKARAAARRERA